MGECVLRAKPYSFDRPFSDGYYTGKRYQYQNEQYACLTHDVSEAKRYKTKQAAENAAKKMLGTIANYEFEAVEIYDRR